VRVWRCHRLRRSSRRSHLMSRNQNLLHLRSRSSCIPQSLPPCLILRWSTRLLASRLAERLLTLAWPPHRSCPVGDPCSSPPSLYPCPCPDLSPDLSLSFLPDSTDPHSPQEQVSPNPQRLQLGYSSFRHSHRLSLVLFLYLDSRLLLSLLPSLHSDISKRL